MSKHALQPLLAPSSILVFTGEDRLNPILHAVLRALSFGGRRGKVFLYGTQPDDSIGVLPFDQLSSLESLANTPDLAILAGEDPRPLTQIIEQCGSLSIPALLVFTGSDENPDEILKAARQHGVRLIGPNSFGMCRPKQGFSAWLGLTQPIPGRLALLSQSGTVASALVDWATWQGIGFSQVVSMGSPIDVMPSQILDYLSNDFESQSILMYLQKIGSTTRFLSSLRAASRSKPVAVVTEHNIGADPRVLDAALSRTGAVRGRRLNDLVAAASVMTNARRVKQGSLMIIGNGSGPGELAAQRAEEVNVNLLSPSEELHTKLEGIMDGRGSIGSVTTAWASCNADLFVDLAETALADKECGAVLLMLSPTALINMVSLYDQVLQLHKKQKKLVMVCMLGGGHMVALRTRINEAGIPTFRTPEAAIEGFQFLVQFHRNQLLAKQTPDSHAFRFNIDVAAARAKLKEMIKAGNKTPTADDLKEVFELFNFRLIARRQSHFLLKKPIHLRSFRDPVFGPAIGLSLEGANQWHHQTEAVALPPLNTILSKDLIQRAFPNVESFELEDLLRSFSTMICELPELEYVELADVRIHESGSIFANVKAKLKSSGKLRRYEHLAIQPYPRQWVKQVTLRDGQDITLRPILPRDAYMMAEFVKNLSHESRYFRFIANIQELTPKMIASLSHIDYDREMALIAVGDKEGEQVLMGAARFSDNFDDKSCEFAVVIGDEYQGHGLAALLMRRLFLVAHFKGIKEMKGTVLAENKRMIDFCRRIGFTIKRDPDDIGLVMAYLRLTPKFIEGVKEKLGIETTSKKDI
ncbi:GNAT family N-acetyltransferase [Marinomonas gallaica]|uniref:bifunctional acetate--CoA ligase family protein/GNAT family N-acetyltransferase n=1 Tax=Marinomonas gallaica TaxID=1806667 RepID=UPI003CE51EC4